MRKKALFIINSLAGGGAERVMVTLLTASAAWRAQYDMSLVLLDCEPAAYTPPEWVDFIQLDCEHRLLASVRQVRRIVRQVQPDITLSFLTRANVANVLATRDLPTACIISERVSTSAHFHKGLSARISRGLVRFAYPKADHVIAVSEGVRDDLAGAYGVPRTRITAIPNPIDHQAIAARAEQPCPLGLDGPYIAAAGRLVSNKNFGLLIDAFARSGIGGALVIMGEGPLRPALAAQARALGLADRVFLPGFVENPFPVLRNASAFALPSNAEGFPNGLVEAMACGVPVVATNCASGPSEILLGKPRQAVTDTTYCDAGAVVPPNDPVALAQALQRVNDPTRRQAQGTAALSLSRRFSAERMAARYWQIITDQVAARQRQPAAAEAMPDAAPRAA